jgi:hypothetical protein
MTADTQAIEESIKIALDAADTATGVTAEFQTIRSDYAKVGGEVRKLYRYTATVFASSLVAAGAAMVVATMMYYRTLGEMQTANTSALEAVILFAENVDRLITATDGISALGEGQRRQTEANQATTEVLARYETLIAGQPAALVAALAAEDPEAPGALVAMEGRLREALETALAAQAADIAALRAALETPAESEASVAAGGPALADAIAKIDAMMLLQQEISAKITAMQRPAPAASSQPASTPRPRNRPQDRASDDNVIKFP